MSLITARITLSDSGHVRASYEGKQMKREMRMTYDRRINLFWGAYSDARISVFVYTKILCNFGVLKRPW